MRGALARAIGGKWKLLLQLALLSALIFALPPLSAAEPPSLLLAEVDRGAADVKLYLVSEKLDGVRAYWDGEHLLSRQGNVINAPAWFIENFPKQPLDGELWMGRGAFESLSSAVRRQIANDDEWRRVRYMLFELPRAPGSFRERAQTLKDLTAAAGVPWLRAVEQFEVGSRQALAKKLNEIVGAGGEGLMLHRADAPYLSGRSDALLKVKPLDDAEATVIGHQPGKGKYRGILGAIRVRNREGVEFSLGSGFSEADRRHPPAIGTVVTYRYRGFTERGIPRFASYYRPYFQEGEP